MATSAFGPFTSASTPAADTRHDKLVNVSVHPDPRVQAVLEQIREAESLQAIDRLRLIFNDERKHVWILCNIPLDLPVDVLHYVGGVMGLHRKTEHHIRAM